MGLQAGQQLGQYTIEDQIGHGGMATVYRAHHPTLDRRVALKIMHTTFLQDEAFRSRFEREARIVARLEHPNIVPVFDSTEHEDRPYLVMKLIEGKTLKQQLIKQPLSLQAMIELMSPIASALDYAHSKGVLHRDIKPSNILIEADTDTPYLTDFGLARIARLGESTISHDMMLGTPFYISPEQAKGERDLTTQADLYSLGIVLYEMITGRVPFHGDTPYAIVYDHIHTPPPPPSSINPDLPPTVDAIFAKALAKDAHDRYANAQDFLHDLAQQLDVDQASVFIPTLEPQNYAAQTPTPESIPTLDEYQGRKIKPGVTVEGSIDFGDLDQLGRQFSSGIQRGAQYIEGLGTLVGNFFDDEPSDETKARKFVEKKYKKRRELMTHIAVYIAVNAMLWFFWGFGGFPWPIFPTVFWGIGLLNEILEYNTKYGAGRNQREAEITQEMERIRRERPEADKRKVVPPIGLEVIEEAPMPPVRLNADGELTDSFIEDQEEVRRQRR